MIRFSSSSGESDVPAAYLHADLYAVDVKKMKKKPSRVVVAPNSRKVPTFTLLTPYYGFLLRICVKFGKKRLHLFIPMVIGIFLIPENGDIFVTTEWLSFNGGVQCLVGL